MKPPRSSWERCRTFLYLLSNTTSVTFSAYSNWHLPYPGSHLFFLCSSGSSVSTCKREARSILARPNTWCWTKHMMLWEVILHSDHLSDLTVHYRDPAHEYRPQTNFLKGVSCCKLIWIHRGPILATFFSKFTNDASHEPKCYRRWVFSGWHIYVLPIPHDQLNPVANTLANILNSEFSRVMGLKSSKHSLMFGSFLNNATTSRLTNLGN